MGEMLRRGTIVSPSDSTLHEHTILTLADHDIAGQGITPGECGRKAGVFAQERTMSEPVRTFEGHNRSLCLVAAAQSCDLRRIEPALHSSYMLLQHTVVTPRLKRRVAGGQQIRGESA
ncbi:MAG: hypothetical protein ACREMH_09530 [Gemmatimonadales bacterium]